MDPISGSTMSSSAIKEKIISPFILRAVPWLAALLIRLLYLTLKVESIEDESVVQSWNEDENFLLITWHEQILMMPKGYHGPGVKLLISRSKDGELLARAMGHFGYGAVRGSSSRGGRTAFRELLGLTKQNVDIAITPDGPRGPRRELKDGVIHLAKVSGRGVVPVAFVCSKGHRFGSWDRFVCPYPTARAVYSYGAPVYYDKETGVEDFRLRLMTAMQNNERLAVARLESYGLSAI